MGGRGMDGVVGVGSPLPSSVGMSPMNPARGDSPGAAMGGGGGGGRGRGGGGRGGGPVGNVLGRVFSDISDHFVLKLEEIGRGRVGSIRLCVSRATGEKFACKTIRKERLQVIGNQYSSVR